MDVKADEIQYGEFNPASPGPYEQYILPHIAKAAARAPERFATFGAAWQGYALGAVAVSKDIGEEEARIESLFVDPTARGRGVGTILTRLAAEWAEEQGADMLELSYCLPGAELAAMDAIVRAMGGEPEAGYPIYTLKSADFRDSPVFGWALSPSFRPAANIRPFTDLRPEQLQRLDENDEIPANLRPAARKDLMDAALSLAWVEDGQIVSYLMTRRSMPGSYAALSGWRSESAPGDSYVHLLMACANLCFYDAGGDFLYHLSPITEHSQALLGAYVQDLAERMEEHNATLWLPLEDEE